MGFGLGVNSWGRRKRRGASGGPPGGAIHRVDYRAANTTLLPAPNDAHIATATDLGTVGGSMVSPDQANPQRRCPTIATLGGVQYADFSDVAGDLFRDYLVHDGEAADFPIGSDTDGNFTVTALFEVTGGLRRYVCTNMAAITSSSSGFYIRHESNRTLDVGMSPVGQAAFVGSGISGPLADDDWHFCACIWGSGTFEHYVNDMATPFASGSYTFSGTGTGPSSVLAHGGNGNDSVTGLSEVSIFARKLTQAERVGERLRMLGSLGL